MTTPPTTFIKRNYTKIKGKNAQLNPAHLKLNYKSEIIITVALVFEKLSMMPRWPNMGAPITPKNPAPRWMETA